MRIVRALLSLAAASAVGCAVNPATGERQLSFIGEEQEIQMGREATQQVEASIGLVDNPELQRYVSGIGQELAATSERPNLPWSFEVADDPVVNAFALPGGFIYVTRGILAHFESEAELAGVLGHEIGHVTARHSVNQMSRQQLGQIGLVAGMILSEDVRRYGDVLAAGLGLLSLKYSRDDETESDELGVRYMTRAGYAPDALMGVFAMLGAVSGGEGRLPEWQSTHPYPENRESHLRELMQEQNVTPGGDVGRDRYLDRIDGILYGQNPREGYFKEGLFLHPEMAFQMHFPSGWNTVNQKSAVAGVSPEQDALVVLELVPDASSPEEGLRAFLGQEGIQAGQTARSEENGIPGVRAAFAAQTSQGQEIRGEVRFLSYRGSIFRILGYGAAERWERNAGAISQTLGSFAPVTDRAVLAVQPRRLEIVTIPSAMTLAEFHRRYPSPVPIEEIALLNRRDPNESIPARTRLKRVVGDPLP